MSFQLTQELESELRHVTNKISSEIRPLLDRARTLSDSDIETLDLARRLIASKDFKHVGYYIQSRTVEGDKRQITVGTNSNFMVKCNFGNTDTIQDAVLYYTSERDCTSYDYRETYVVAGLAAPMLLRRDTDTEAQETP